MSKRFCTAISTFVLLTTTATASTFASDVVTQTEERSFFSLWLLSDHAQQSIAHRQIINEHNVTAVPVFDEASLAGADVVYLSPALDELQLTDAEMDALTEFVSAGGRLIVPADNGIWANEFRALAARFDVTYGESFINGFQNADVEDTDNPIMNGPAGVIEKFQGASINDNLASTNPDFRALARWQVGPVSVGYLEVGLGHIVFLSDFNTFDNDMIANFDNQELWINLFATTGDYPELTILGACPGNMQFTVDYATPNSNVAFLYASGAGSIAIPNGNPCAGTILGLDASAQLAGVRQSDANGTASVSSNVPNAACNRIHIQALDIATCEISNVIRIQ